MAFRDLGDSLWCAFSHDLPTTVAPFGTDVDDPVGSLDDVQIVLDDNDTVALLDQLMQHLKELADILKMEAGRRLVQNVERASSRSLGEFL